MKCALLAISALAFICVGIAQDPCADVVCGAYSACRVEANETVCTCHLGYPQPETGDCKIGILLIGGFWTSHELWTSTSQSVPQFDELPGGSIRSDYRGSRAVLDTQDNKIISCGGGSWRSGDECWSADAAGGAWTRMPHMKEARRGHTLTSFGNVTVAAGGEDHRVRRSSVEILRKGGAWTKADWGLKEATAYHCAVASSPSHLLVIGGSDGYRMLTGAYKINIEDGSRRQLPSLPYGVYDHACTMLNQTHVMLAGGSTASSFFSSEVMVLDTSQGEGGEWESMPALNRGRSDHSMVKMAGHVYVLGGWGAGDEVKKSVEKWDVEKWEEVVPGLEKEFGYGGAVVV